MVAKVSHQNYAAKSSPDMVLLQTIVLPKNSMQFGSCYNIPSLIQLQANKEISLPCMKPLCWLSLINFWNLHPT